MSLEPADAIVERLDSLHVWPQSIACHYADTLTPRQISELYQIGAVATAAKARIATLEAEVARLREALSNPPKHKFWGAGEPDCPRELKAGNGELHTLRCKVCGEDNPRDSICRWAIGTRESDSDAAMRFIDKLRADYGTVTILPDNEEADTKAEQMAIDCCGEWTNWQDQRFYGETILQCLAKAVVVQEKARAALEARND